MQKETAESVEYWGMRLIIRWKWKIQQTVEILISIEIIPMGWELMEV